MSPAAGLSAVIPAAGIGRRFQPLSRVVPKEMLLLGDRPIVHHALDELAEAGFAAALLVTAPWKRTLFERYLEVATAPLAVEIVEQPEALGIGDAILRAAVFAGSRFGVLLPDDVVRERSHWAVLMQDPDPALCVREVPSLEIGRFGIAEVRAGRCVELIEKPDPGSTTSNLAIFGRYQVTSSVLENLERLAAQRLEGELQLTDGFIGTLPRAVPYEGEIFDCGTPAEYQQSCARWRLPK